jgi:hypothetical protein
MRVCFLLWLWAAFMSLKVGFIGVTVMLGALCVISCAAVLCTTGWWAAAQGPVWQATSCVARCFSVPFILTLRHKQELSSCSAVPASRALHVGFSNNLFTQCISCASPPCAPVQRGVNGADAIAMSSLVTYDDYDDDGANQGVCKQHLRLTRMLSLPT